MTVLKHYSTRFFNSKFWFNIYYKHTKKHKEDLRLVKEGVLKRRLEIIGK